MFDWFWEFLYGLVKVALFCIDFVVGVAEMLCGIEPVTVDGKEVEITQYLLTSRSVVEAFIWVCIIGFILLFIFTAFTVFRSIAKNGEGKSPVHICFDASKILLYFLMVPLFMVLASVGVSTVMTSIYQATSAGNQGLAESLFVIFAEEAYEGPSGDKAAVLNAFLTGEYDYYSTSQVSSHFDLSEFNYFLGFVGGIAVLVLLVLALLPFVERIINLVVLFIIAPVSMSTAPLDDGARFKLWRDQVINKFLTAYGALIALNVFMIVVGIVNKIEFYDSAFMNGLARLLFIIGGAFACRKSIIMIGNLINQGAGSQDAMDNAHMNAGMRQLAMMAMSPAGAVAGFAARNASRVAFKPARMLGKSIRGRASSAIHRRSQASREVKLQEAKDRRIDKLRSTRAAAAPSAQTAQGRTGNAVRDAVLNNSGAVNQPPPPPTPPPLPETDSLNRAGAEKIGGAVARAQDKKADGEKKKGD